MSYVEVPDSDTDDDVFVPESSNNSAGAPSRLKRQKTSTGNASTKPPSATTKAVEAKTAPRKAYGDVSSEVLELDGSPERKTGMYRAACVLAGPRLCCFANSLP